MITPIRVNSLRISASPTLKMLSEAIGYAAKKGCGIELRYPAPFDKTDVGFNPFKNELAEAFRGFPYRVSVHAFTDGVDFVSGDRAISVISRKRGEQSLEVLNALHGGDVVNFHTGHNPFWRAPNYDTRNKDNLIAFWKDFIKSFEKSHKIAVLENSLETEPEFILDIVKAVNSPNLKICLDTGHVNLQSKTPLETWVEKCREFLHHVHLHNNDGVSDQHRPFYDGTIDMGKFFAALKKHNVHPNVVLEVKTLKDTVDSVDAFKKFSI